MEDSKLLERCKKLSEELVTKELKVKQKTILRKAAPVEFFFGNFAELAGLHFLYYKNFLSKGLSHINKFRNTIISKISDPTEEVRYEVTCSQRLSGKTLFIICESLGIPCIVAYTTYFYQSEKQKIQAVFILEQGGCTAIANPSKDQISVAKKRRLRIGKLEN